jgi:hypothetical protein
MSIHHSRGDLPFQKNSLHGRKSTDDTRGPAG